MKIQRLSEADFSSSTWSGGKTTEMLLYPSGTSYAARDFDFRISSATVRDGTSEFTLLPGVERQLMVLEGRTVLTHDGGAPVPLPPYVPHHFSGGSRTASRGACTDFNVMLRRGWTAKLSALHLNNEGQTTVFAAADFAVLYFAENAGWVQNGGELLRCGAKELVVLERERGEPLCASVFAPRGCVVVQALLRRGQNAAKKQSL